MLRSLYAGVSGLKNHQIRMDVIGDNIANVNTIGFKASRVVFQTLLAQMLKGAASPTEERGGVNPQEVGLGMLVASIEKIMSQGNLQTTGKNSDLAIQGNGFFMVTDGAKTYYTRAGAFNVDAHGNLVNPEGLKVLGWKAVRDAQGNLRIDTAATPEPIVIPVGQKMPARATTYVKYRCNLDARTYVFPREVTIDITDDEGNLHHTTISFRYDQANDRWVWTVTADRAEAGAAFATGATGFITRGADGRPNGVTGFPVDLNDADDPTPDAQLVAEVTADGVVFRVSGAYGETATPVTAKYDVTKSHYTSVEVYDSQGNTHRLTIRFEKPDPAQNVWRWYAEVEAPATIVSGGSGTVVFNQDGSLASFTYDGGVNAMTIATNTGAGNITLTINPGTPGLFDGITQLASESTTVAVEQDGYSLGVLETFTVDDRGVITGIYTNGQTQPIAQVALALFANPSGLNRRAGNLYEVSNNSGMPLVGPAGTGGRGSISAGTLEMSNVDLATEFVDMIVTQRGFQANSRVITTSDQMLQELLTLKR